jgi:hypothetical protein
VFQPNAPLEFTCILKNQTRKPVRILESGIWPNYKFVVRDLQGVEPPLTPFGKQARERYRSPDRDKNFTVIIDPGRAYKRTVDISRLYTLGRGRWRLAVSHEPCGRALPRELVAPEAAFAIGSDLR